MDNPKSVDERKSKKGHICESCGNTFSEAGNLKRHIYTIHEGHKDHKCESCGKSFSQAGVLNRHIYTIHEGHKGRRNMEH